MAAAEAALASAAPEDVLAGALRHFQSLFGCSTLTGVVPAMNKVRGLVRACAGVCVCMCAFACAIGCARASVWAGKCACVQHVDRGGAGHK